MKRYTLQVDNIFISSVHHPLSFQTTQFRFEYPAEVSEIPNLICSFLQSSSNGVCHFQTIWQSKLGKLKTSTGILFEYFKVEVNKKIRNMNWPLLGRKLTFLVWSGPLLFPLAIYMGVPAEEDWAVIPHHNSLPDGTAPSLTWPHLLVENTNVWIAFL